MPIQKILGDGNCFFRAVAERIGVPHEVVRRELLDYIERNASTFQALCGIEDALEFFTELSELCTLGRWNNRIADVLPYVLSEFYGIHVRVLNKDFKTLQSFRSKCKDAASLTLMLNASHYDLVV